MCRSGPRKGQRLSPGDRPQSMPQAGIAARAPPLRGQRHPRWSALCTRGKPGKDACHAALASSVSSTCRWHGRISGANSGFRRQRKRNQPSTLSGLSSGEPRIPPIRTGSRVEVRASNAIWNRRGGHAANGNLGNGILRPETSTARAANEPRRPWNKLASPIATAVSRGNVVLFCGERNQVDLRRLLGGAEGFRAAMLLGDTLWVTASIREGIDGAQRLPRNRLRSGLSTVRLRVSGMGRSTMGAIGRCVNEALETEVMPRPSRRKTSGPRRPWRLDIISVRRHSLLKLSSLARGGGRLNNRPALNSGVPPRFANVTVR